jgi:hypothetical protein
LVFGSYEPLPRRPPHAGPTYLLVPPERFRDEPRVLGRVYHIMDSDTCINWALHGWISEWTDDKETRIGMSVSRTAQLNRRTGESAHRSIQFYCKSNLVRGDWLKIRQLDLPDGLCAPLSYHHPRRLILVVKVKAHSKHLWSRGSHLVHNLSYLVDEADATSHGARHGAGQIRPRDVQNPLVLQQGSGAEPTIERVPY